jgi:hypothetical protein
MFQDAHHHHQTFVAAGHHHAMQQFQQQQQQLSWLPPPPQSAYTHGEKKFILANLCVTTFLVIHIFPFLRF